MKKDREADRRDAERYRFLRSERGLRQTDLHIGYISEGDAQWRFYNDACDSEVDSAIKAEGAEPTVPSKGRIQWTGKNWPEVFRFITNLRGYRSHALDPSYLLEINGDGRGAIIKVGNWIDADILAEPTSEAYEISKLVKWNLRDIHFAIDLELNKAVFKFPTWPNDPVHASHVIQEEAGELAKAVLETMYEHPKSTIADVRKEAVQAAAMCVRFLLSMHKYDFTPAPQHKQEL